MKGYNIETQPQEKREAPVTYNTAVAIARIWAKKAKSPEHETKHRIAAHLWNLGKAGDPLSFVSWNKLNDDGKYSEASHRRGYKPDGAGWSLGKAPSVSIDLTDYRTRKKEVLRMAREERKHLKDIKDQKVDMFGMKPNIPWDEEKMIPALKFYNSVLKDPDRWMKDNGEGLPVYGRITGENGAIVPFKFNSTSSDSTVTE